MIGDAGPMLAEQPIDDARREVPAHAGIRDPQCGVHVPPKSSGTSAISTASAIIAGV